MNEPCRDNKNDIITVLINFHALGGATAAGLHQLRSASAIGLQLQPPPDTTLQQSLTQLLDNLHRRKFCDTQFSVWFALGLRAVVFTVTEPRLPAVVNSCRDSLAAEAEC